MSTIHALASGPPPAGIAVVRVSGPLVPRLVADWIGHPLPPRVARLVTLRSADGAPLDEALALRFVAPRSFTGEDVLELHCHGGRAVVAAVERRLVELGSRAAEPGEFTMRAHANGRVDLMEAERLADLIDAETEAQRKLAASETGRRNAALYDTWRLALLDARALCEAAIDFADEEDAPEDVSDEVAAILSKVLGGIDAHLANWSAARIVRDGLRVALAGAPNAGKSSLLNALAGSDVAIVMDVPGTTRDAIEVPLDVGGYKVVLFDLAGLRDSDDPVERVGVERARARIAEADVVLHCVPPGSDPGALGVEPERVVRLATKSDLGGRADGLPVSAHTGEGLDRLLRVLCERASAGLRWNDTVPLAERHLAHLDRTRANVRAALATQVPELAAEHIRLAADELGRITGATDIEDVYGAIFSRFCMGK